MWGVLAVAVVVGALSGGCRAELELPVPKLPQCPEDYDEVKPWYEDPDDCNCYYVCDMYGGMVRMCCPADLWFDSNTMNCHYWFSFTEQKQSQCLGSPKGEGTTKQLKEVFVGRCWDYQLYRHPQLFQQGGQVRDCEALYAAFTRAFSGKAACGEVSGEMYDEFLQMAQHDIPTHGHLFWSGTRDAAHSYSHEGTRLMTLEQTLAGYVTNSLTWCGERDAGMDHKACPAWASCEGEPLSAFWARASQKFASQAAGVATVMLNGSMAGGREAYRNSSFFSQYEIVNMHVPQVHTLRIWLVHDLDKPATETCDFGSVRQLQDQAQGLGMKVVCEDNPPEVHAMLCMDAPHFPECAAYHDASAATGSPGGGGVRLPTAQLIRDEDDNSILNDDPAPAPQPLAKTQSAGQGAQEGVQEGTENQIEKGEEDDDDQSVFVPEA